MIIQAPRSMGRCDAGTARTLEVFESPSTAQLTPSHPRFSGLIAGTEARFAEVEAGSPCPAAWGSCPDLIGGSGVVRGRRRGPAAARPIGVEELAARAVD